MRSVPFFFLMQAIWILPIAIVAQAQSSVPPWVATSNSYTNQLLTLQMKHHPETGSAQGLSEYDTKISQPTLADEDQERQETAELLSKFKVAA